MQIQEKQVILRKLVASDGKILVSKTLDEEGNPTVRTKEIYLANGASEDDFEEIDEVTEVTENTEVDENTVESEEA
jgi:hypothetical protein